MLLFTICRRQIRVVSVVYARESSRDERDVEVEGIEGENVKVEIAVEDDLTTSESSAIS
jgi:hypothetical protein